MTETEISEYLATLEADDVTLEGDGATTLTRGDGATLEVYWDDAADKGYAWRFLGRDPLLTAASGGVDSVRDLVKSFRAGEVLV